MSQKKSYMKSNNIMTEGLLDAILKSPPDLNAIYPNLNNNSKSSLRKPKKNKKDNPKTT